MVTAANVHDSRAVPELLDAVRAAGFGAVRIAFADAAYGGQKRAAACRGMNVEIVKRSDYTEAKRAGPRAAGKPFVALPKRWVIERTFSHLTWSRRLCASYDRLTQVVEGWVMLGSLRHTLSKW